MDSEDRESPNRKSVEETSLSANTCIDDMVEEMPPCASCTREPEEPPTDIDTGTEWQRLKEDLDYLISLVDQYVTVHMKNNKSIAGFVYCVDRNDFTIILNVPIDGSYQPMCIPEFSIRNVIRSRAPSDLAPPPRMTPSPPISEDDELPVEQTKRAIVVAWYPSNQVQQSGEFITDVAQPNCVTEVYSAKVDDLLRTVRQNAAGVWGPSTSQ